MKTFFIYSIIPLLKWECLFEDPRQNKFGAGKFELGAPGRTRTLNLLVRSQTLYPIELRAQRQLLVFAGHFSEPSVVSVKKCPGSAEGGYLILHSILN